jgi:hypothetical protein
MDEVKKSPLAPAHCPTRRSSQGKRHNVTTPAQSIPSGASTPTLGGHIQRSQSGVGSAHSIAHIVHVKFRWKFESIPVRQGHLDCEVQDSDRSGYRLSASRDVQLRATFLKHGHL